VFKLSVAHNFTWWRASRDQRARSVKKSAGL
jgi:hypothetical protein